MKRAKDTLPSCSDEGMCPPALTPEGRENQLIALAFDRVEKRLRDGTASSQETVHFLKLASSKTRAENELLKEQLELYKAKTDALRASARNDEATAAVLRAISRYSGDLDEDE